jgi:hypothetical protein
MSTTTTTRLRADLSMKIRSGLHADPLGTPAMAAHTSRTSKPRKYRPVSTRHPALRSLPVRAPNVSVSIRGGLRDWAAGGRRWARQ